MEIPEMGQKIEKKFFVFQIIAFEIGVGNSRNIEQDPSHQQPICEQSPFRFHLTISEIFSK